MVKVVRKKTSKHALSKWQKKEVKSMLNRFESKRIETKRYVQEFTGSATTTPAFLDLTTGIAQGITDEQRIGDQITVKSITIRGILYITPATGDIFNNIRLTLFQWKADPAVDTPSAGVLWYPAFYSAGHAYFSPFQLSTKSKYHIIKDKMYTMTLTGENECLHFKIVLHKGFVRNITYDELSGTASINTLYLAVQSDSNVTVHPGYALSSEIDYTDS